MARPARSDPAQIGLGGAAGSRALAAGRVVWARMAAFGIPGTERTLDSPGPFVIARLLDL